MILKRPLSIEDKQSALDAIQSAIVAVTAQKPADRSELDRAYAVTITHLETAFAYFATYAIAVFTAKTLENAFQQLDEAQSRLESEQANQDDVG